MVFNIILMTLGLVALVESIMVMLFPNWTISIGKKWLRSIKSVRRVGLVELIVALVLILIGMNI